MKKMSIVLIRRYKIIMNSMVLIALIKNLKLVAESKKGEEADKPMAKKEKQVKEAPIKQKGVKKQKNLVSFAQIQQDAAVHDPNGQAEADLPVQNEQPVDHELHEQTNLFVQLKQEASEGQSNNNVHDAEGLAFTSQSPASDNQQQAAGTPDLKVISFFQEPQQLGTHEFNDDMEDVVLIQQDRVMDFTNDVDYIAPNINSVPSEDSSSSHMGYEMQDYIVYNQLANDDFGYTGESLANPTSDDSYLNNEENIKINDDLEGATYGQQQNIQYYYDPEMATEIAQ